MKIPWIIFVGSGSHALPLLAAAVRRHKLGVPRKWILLWCGFLTSMSALSLVLALQGRNNHWMQNVVTPIAAGLVLWALSWWQASRRAALAIRLMIPLVVIAWIPMVTLVEEAQSFSLLAEPFVGMVVLATAIYTLASRTLWETGSLSQQDWFWAATGVALYHGAVVGLHPASYWLMKTHPHLVVRALELNSLIEVVAFLAVAWGMTREGSPLRIRTAS